MDNEEAKSENRSDAESEKASPSIPDAAAETRGSGPLSAASLEEDRNLVEKSGLLFLFLGFIQLAAAAYCFIVSRRGEVLEYRDFAFNPDYLGQILLIGGAITYILGRVLGIWGKRIRRRSSRYGV